jgi:GAF domain-containing protein/CheY-like chemotaxis protein
MGHGASEDHVLIEAARLLASGLEPDDVLSRLAELLRTTLGLDLVRIWLREADGALAVRVQVGTTALPPPKMTVRPGEGLVGRVLEQRRPLAVRDLQGDPRLKYLGRLVQEGLVSGIVAPLLVQDDVVGVLSAGSQVARDFSRDEVAIAEALATCAAAVVRSARLTEELGARLRETQILLSVAQTAGAVLDLPEIARRTIRAMVQALGADMGGVWEIDAGGTTLVPLAGYHIPAHVAGQLSADQLPTTLAFVADAWSGLVHIEDSQQDSRADNPLLRLVPHQSILAMPMLVQDQLLGGFTVLWVRERHVLTAEERRLVEGIAAQTAIAMQNARLLRAERQERRLAEREAALVAISGELATEIDVDRLLPRIAEEARRLLGTDAALLLAVEGENLAVRSAVGFDPSPLMLEPLSIAESLTGVVVFERCALVQADLGAEPAGRDTTLVRALGYRAMCAVPMIVKDSVLGVLQVLHRDSRRFADEDVQLLQALATQAALAIDHARLFQQTQNRLQETRTLLAITQALSSTLDLAETMRRVAREIGRTLGADTVGAYLADPEGAALHAIAGYHVPRERIADFLAHPFPITRSAPMEATWQERRAIYSSDVANDPRLHGESWGRFPHQSVLFVPMVLKDEPFGAFVAIWWKARREFRPDELRLVEAISDQAAMFVANARLYEEMRRRQREAQELARLARMLTESLDTADVVERIADSARQLLSARLAVLRVRQPDGTLTLLASSGEMQGGVGPLPATPSGGGIAGRAAAEGVPVWTADVLTDPDVVMPAEMRRHVEQGGLRAVLAVPLRAKRQIIGVVGVADPAGRRFTEAEVALLGTFADQAAVALENSRLYGDLRSALSTVEESQQRIVQGERLRALGEMAGGVAHDFNNFLAIITGRAESLVAEASDPELRRQLRVILKVALDAGQTVRRIGDFTRMRRARPFQPVDLRQIVEEVVEVTRSRWKDEPQARGIAYEMTLAPDATPPMAGDPSELREALTNIVFNAIDAMPEGGRLGLRTGVADDHVFCALTDTGIGMHEDVRQRIFDPFFTTKGERGTGLGLSVVYGIVTRHGGEVQVQSAPGRGSTFTLRFPRAAEPLPAAPAVPVVPAPRTGRILVIDDEEEIASAMGELLRRDGHEVVVCHDGRSGLAQFEAAPFDLVLTDLGMPGISGWEVSRRVKACRPGTPVAMVTGWGDQIDPARTPEVDHLLAKPFKRAEIRAVVAAALNRPAATAD